MDPIMILYRDSDTVSNIIRRIVTTEPLIETSVFGSNHLIWEVSSAEVQLFPSFYVFCVSLYVGYYRNY